jgi:hypothetical protein
MDNKPHKGTNMLCTETEFLSVYIPRMTNPTGEHIRYVLSVHRKKFCYTLQITYPKGGPIGNAIWILGCSQNIQKNFSGLPAQNITEFLSDYYHRKTNPRGGLCQRTWLHIHKKLICFYYAGWLLGKSTSGWTSLTASRTQCCSPPPHERLW